MDQDYKGAEIPGEKVGLLQDPARPPMGMVFHGNLSFPGPGSMQPIFGARSYPLHADQVSMPTTPSALDRDSPTLDPLRYIPQSLSGHGGSEQQASLPVSLPTSVPALMAGRHQQHLHNPHHHHHPHPVGTAPSAYQYQRSPAECQVTPSPLYPTWAQMDYQRAAVLGGPADGGFSDQRMGPYGHHHHHHHAAPYYSPPYSSGALNHGLANMSSALALGGIAGHWSQAAQGTSCASRPRKKRVPYSKQQISELERAFDENRFLTPELRLSISHRLSLTERQVKIWFQNQRQKEKKLMRRQQSGAAANASNINNGSGGTTGSATLP
ncbi:homeobox protein Hox-B9-like [Lethenteron reissneri]|nr:homeobox protein Hox-B9-like [Lethenteron reissneri]